MYGKKFQIDINYLNLWEKLNIYEKSNWRGKSWNRVIKKTQTYLFFKIK